MKTIEDLTPEIESKIDSYIKSGLEGVFDGGRYNDFNLQDAIAAVNHNYEVCGYKKPFVFVAENPLEAQIFFNYISFLVKNDVETWNDFLNQQLKNELSKFNYDYLFTLNVYSDCYYNWFEFIRKELSIDIDEDLNNLFQKTFSLQKKSGIYSAIFSEKVCVVSKYPKKIYRNNSFDLHNTEDVSIDWSSSLDFTRFFCYYIDGRNIDKEDFFKIKEQTYTTEDFFREKNEEVKSNNIYMMEKLYGGEYVLDFFRKNLIEINTYVDKKDEKYLEGTTGGMNVGVYTLFKGNVNGTELAAIRCYCPSSDRMFLLPVHPSNDNAKDAIASLYKIPRKFKDHIVYILRQGERFATVLDAKTTKKLKNGAYSKEDLQDTVSISGDKYFSLMRYEY